jgi:hypothetical protein
MMPRWQTSTHGCRRCCSGATSRAPRLRSNSQLGRNLQEDLAIHPDGITDWGTRETLTAIDLVMWRNGGTDKDAAFWLCDRLGRSPDTFGWNKNLDSNLRPYRHPPRAGAAQGRAKGTSADEARETLEKILDEFMEEALYKHELWSEIERMVADYDVIADAEAKAAVSNMTGDPAKIEAKMRAKKAEILARSRPSSGPNGKARRRSQGTTRSHQDHDRSRQVARDPPNDREVYPPGKAQGLVASCVVSGRNASPCR